VPTRAASPYRGLADADPQGTGHQARIGWAPRTRTGKLSVQGRAGLPDSPIAHWSRRPVPIRTARFTGAGPQPCAAARVSPVRFERTLPPASGACLLPLGYEDVEPIPGVEPGRPPYEGGAASRAHRHELPLVDSNHD
jgi:hypothetical protein